MMENYLEKLPKYVEIIESIKELIITNIVLIGQIPAPTFREKRRVRVFLERMADYKVDECATDGYRNAISVIRGTSSGKKPPVFLIAHLDTAFDKDVDHNFSIHENYITGAGIADNSVGAGVLISMPEILRRLDLRFESDIVIAGVIQSIGKGNMRGIRHLLKTWNTPIRGAVCVEGGDLGRLNYYANGMIRAEVECTISTANRWQQLFAPNAILILNEVINGILQLRLL